MVSIFVLLVKFSEASQEHQFFHVETAGSVKSTADNLNPDGFSGMLVFRDRGG
jgi:hypothetical protein